MFLIFFLVFAASLPAFAQESGEVPGGTAASFVAASFPALSAAVPFLPLVWPETAGIAPWIAYPLRLGAAVPMYWIDVPRAIGYTAAGLLLPAAGVPLMLVSSSVPVATPVSQSLLNAYAHLMEFAAYDAWRLERPGETGWGLGTLSVSPFEGRQLSDPVVWAASIAAPAVLTAFYLLNEPDLGRPVYQTNTSYIGSLEVPAWAGGLAALGFAAVDMLAVAIGEEAYYRGIVYKELKSAWGPAPARITDALLFPLIHLPGDLRAELKPSTIVFLIFHLKWILFIKKRDPTCVRSPGAVVVISLPF
ncbi:MAG: CPBP family intramembrane metalloprotease [Candidatus Coatesbacteria bacterium]|nr:CPBP family intramembrane metalloprotease [Candidatus Coatesbacteria bacterium]